MRKTILIQQICTFESSTAIVVKKKRKKDSDQIYVQCILQNYLFDCHYNHFQLHWEQRKNKNYANVRTFFLSFFLFWRKKKFHFILHSQHYVQFLPISNSYFMIICTCLLGTCWKFAVSLTHIRFILTMLQLDNFFSFFLCLFVIFFYFFQSFFLLNVFHCYVTECISLLHMYDAKW